MTTTAAELVDVFTDAGLACARQGLGATAAQFLASRLIAEGHGQALAEVTAQFWMANEARKAHQDQWDAYERASLDKTGQQPPPPPDPEPEPEPEPTPPPEDRL